MLESIPKFGPNIKSIVCELFISSAKLAEYVNASWPWLVWPVSISSNSNGLIAYAISL